MGLVSVLAFGPGLFVGCLSTGPDASGDRVAISVAPLTLSDVTDARYRVTVTNGSGHTVWSEELTSSRFGDGRGSLSYVGTCDAGDNDNVVTLELLDLYQGEASLVDAATYQNPGPVSKTVHCAANSDVGVAFDLTILRDAHQGFFDVAVEFEDVFCSAKLDCVDQDGAELMLLNRPDGDGARGRSAVLALACSAGTDADTTLYLSSVEVRCGSELAVIDPSVGPGNLSDGNGITQTGGTPLFGAAVYRGQDELGARSRFWNVVLGLNGSASCRVSATATAQAAGQAWSIPAGATVYPFIAWDAPLTGTSGERACARHAVNAGSEVATHYATPAAPEVFDFAFGPDGITRRDTSCAPSDPDADHDGTPDCADGCVTDPLKTAPGACGCGTVDADPDLDGSASCIDGCPDDANKTAAGLCGCGVSDFDADGDGVPDCNDGCPADRFKSDAGVCGCGVLDLDLDGDLTPNCLDGCPADALKLDPGVCGCGIADSDGDGDLTPDCHDDCPADPDKTAAGVCGCGVADADGDGDGTATCVDGCPSDPTKVAPGACGCGVPDTDSDHDGSFDCDDGCPSDPGKTAPGICGCGTSDGDNDGDLTPNCQDGCPSDPGKTAPGACGCGTADVDSDGDLTLDCQDGCPSDPTKTAPGACGCGVAETVCGPKLVFVTSVAVSANFGALTNADQRCQNLANVAGIGASTGRTFKAWISSDSGGSAASRLFHATTDYVRRDGVVIAHGWSDLTDGSILATISRDENNVSVPDANVWSSTYADGTLQPGQSCNNWTWTIGNTYTVAMGGTSRTDYWYGQWNGGNVCNVTARFYCFQQ
ncbi:MAG: hypothetical protein U1F43_06730 [Myxococcota bacterium]